MSHLNGHYDNQVVNSPFRYAGGKFYARKLILAHVPSHSFFVEPFAGGASIFFAKPKVAHNWLNDLDKDVVNMYEIIRDYPFELIKGLQGEEATKERHTYYKNEYKPTTDLERAIRWYYLNRTSYSGIMNVQNCFWGYGDKYSMRPENWPRNILRTSSKLQGVKITAWDFETVIDQVPDKSFLFVDPPYFNADQDKFYNHTFNYEGHLRLAECLFRHRKRIKFLLTYDNHPKIREMYGWAEEMHDKEWNYTLNRTDDQKKNAQNTPKEKGSRYKGKEVFIINYISPPTPIKQDIIVEQERLF